MIIKDQRGLNILQVVQDRTNLEIYDFNSNSSVYLGINYLYLKSPIGFWQNATGLLVDGSRQNNRTSSSIGAQRNFFTLNIQFT